MLAARPPLPLVDVPRGGRPLRPVAVGGLIAGVTGLSIADDAASCWAMTPAGCSTGDGALSLMGLISSGRGWIGDLGDLRLPRRSTFFHLVEDTDVLIGDGLGGFLITSEVEIGVCWSIGRGV